MFHKHTGSSDRIINLLIAVAVTEEEEEEEEANFAGHGF